MFELEDAVTGNLLPVGLFFLLGYFDSSVPALVLAMAAVVAFMLERESRKWRRLQRMKRAERLANLGESALLQNMKLPDDKKKFLQDGFDEANWLNKIASEFWRDLDNSTVDKAIIQLVEPLMRQSLRNQSSLIKGVELKRIFFGDLSPTVDKIYVHKTRKIDDPCAVDFHLGYRGNVRIQLSVASISAGITITEFSGLFRAVIHKRSGTVMFPFMELTSLSKPKLNFDLEGLANLLDFPGISDIVHKSVKQSLGNAIVFPKRLLIPLQDQELADCSQLVVKPKGAFCLRILSATGLRKSDVFGEVQPYCKIKLGNLKHTTKTSSGKNPIWGERFLFPLSHPANHVVEISVLDQDTFSDDDVIGTVELDVKRYLNSEKSTVSMDIEGSKTGKLNLEYQWVPVLEDESNGQRPAAIMLVSLCVGKVSAPSHLSLDQIEIVLTIGNQKTTFGPIVGQNSESNSYFKCMESYTMAVKCEENEDDINGLPPLTVAVWSQSNQRVSQDLHILFPEDFLIEKEYDNIEILETVHDDGVITMELSSRLSLLTEASIFKKDDILKDPLQILPKKPQRRNFKFKKDFDSDRNGREIPILKTEKLDWKIGQPSNNYLQGLTTLRHMDSCQTSLED